MIYIANDGRAQAPEHYLLLKDHLPQQRVELRNFFFGNNFHAIVKLMASSSISLLTSHFYYSNYKLDHAFNMVKMMNIFL